jgi:hypothetical protein
MLDEMGAETFRDWRRYYDLEPWGEERQDTRNALLGYAICRGLGMPKITLKSFMPIAEEAAESIEPQQSAEQMIQIAHMITALQAGRLAGSVG